MLDPLCVRIQEICKTEFPHFEKKNNIVFCTYLPQTEVSKAVELVGTIFLKQGIIRFVVEVTWALATAVNPSSSTSSSTLSLRGGAFSLVCFFISSVYCSYKQLSIINSVNFLFTGLKSSSPDMSSKNRATDFNQRSLRSPKNAGRCMLLSGWWLVCFVES